MRSVSLKTMQKMAKLWPLDLSSVLSGEVEEDIIDPTLLQPPQIQEILHSITSTTHTDRQTDEATDQPMHGRQQETVAPAPVAAETETEETEAEDRITHISVATHKAETGTNSPPILRKSNGGWAMEPPAPSPPAASPVQQSPPRRPVSLSTPLPQCHEPQQSQQKREQQLESMDKSLLELLLSSLPPSSVSLSSPHSSSRIELLGGCQEDFEAIDEELLQFAIQQQQSQQPGERRRNYEEMLHLTQETSTAAAAEEQSLDLFRSEFQQFWIQENFEERRRDLLLPLPLHSERSPFPLTSLSSLYSLSPRSTPNQRVETDSDSEVKLLKIDSFDSETFPFL
jgi:hypothetical protein